MLKRRASVSTAVLLLCLGSSTVAAQQGQNQAPLPEGAGRELVESTCTRCHGLGQIRGAVGYDADGWRDLIATMVDLPASQASRAATYLAANFPERSDRQPTLMPGNVEIEITEWIVPTLGQRSRDPAEAPDGSIWWTGMWASLAGRLDPATGRMEEFQLPESARQSLRACGKLSRQRSSPSQER